MEAVMGIDFGTASGRAVVFDARGGAQLGECVEAYPHGVIPYKAEPQAVRHDPHDYLFVLEKTMRGALEDARRHNDSFTPSQVRAVAIDTTGSSMMPLKRDLSLLRDDPAFQDNPNAMLWLWKDHSAAREAEEISQTQAPFLTTTGGRCPTEMPWPRLVHLARTDRATFDAAYTWVEMDDWLPFVLTGRKELMRSHGGLSCKWFYRDDLGGFPSPEYLDSLAPGLSRLLATFPPSTIKGVDQRAGLLCPEWAEKSGLEAGIPVAVGIFDGPSGGLGGGLRPDTLVETIGTSASDIMLVPATEGLPQIHGMFGVAKDGLTPGWYMVEAGRSAVGDLLGWYVHTIAPKGNGFAELDAKAGRLRPGQCGLLALDWMNGSRSVFNDATLSGMILGLTLQSTPEDIYRALVESTAFGARMIVDEIEQAGHPIHSVIVCGGIPQKNRMLVEIYADVLDREVCISKSTQTCALGAAMIASVVAGIYPTTLEAARRMSGVLEPSYKPRTAHRAVYDQLYGWYRELSYAFAEGRPVNLKGMMEKLRALG